MIAQPVIENDYYDPLKSLQHSKNKNLAHHTFRFTHSQIERIEVCTLITDLIIVASTGEEFLP